MKLKGFIKIVLICVSANFYSLAAQNIISNKIISEQIRINTDCVNDVLNKFGKTKLKRSREWGGEDGKWYYLNYNDLTFIFTKKEKKYYLLKIKIKTSQYKIIKNISIGSNDSTVFNAIGNKYSTFENTVNEKMLAFQNIDGQNLYVYFIRKNNVFIVNEIEVW